MSEKKTTYTKLYFRSVPPKTGYFAGAVHEVPEADAERYVYQGYARTLTPTLPKDIPGREELIENDVFTLIQVQQQADSLESLFGIGKTTASKIRAYLKKESTKD